MREPTMPPDRAARALADSLDGARARRAQDAADPAVPVAATVVIVRDGVDGPEVLFIERPDRGSFAGAWVFPGGKLEDIDCDGAADEAGAALAAAVRETHEETGLVIEPGDLVPLSVWDPPPGIAARIRTWFFLVAAPAGDLVLQPEEAVAAEWLRPAEALARHGRGGFTLYPPTWVTLHALEGSDGAADALATARLRALERYETVARRAASGALLLWAGDAVYVDEQAADTGARHRLDISALPWEYLRTP